MECYKVTIECSTKEIAKSIQKWVNKNFYSDEVYWNAVTEIKPKDSKEKK